MLARSSEFHLLTLGMALAGCTVTAPDLTPLEPSIGGKGGALGAGGSGNAASSGSGAGAQGGVTANGGAGTGGAAGAGGHVTGAGGTGATSTAGAPGGGRAATAGAPSSGGVPASGGVPNVAGGGATSSAGRNAMGGVPGAGGFNAGGTPGRGGAPMGGAAATGAAGTGMAGDTSTEMCPAGSHSSPGTKHCGMSDSGTADGNYTYNIYSDGKGSGCMTTYGVDATFSATWTGVGDWIARVGLAFDKTKTYDQIGVFSSDFAYTMTGITSGGFGNVGIYGWSVNPLHEYYIIENWLGKRPNFTQVDTLTIDGEGTYEIQSNTQNNQPNITGTNATFVQFWSVRTTPRQCGHISISKHFDKWKSLGMTLGNLEEARILVEAQNNTGSMDFTTGTVVVTK